MHRDLVKIRRYTRDRRSHCSHEAENFKEWTQISLCCKQRQQCYIHDSKANYGTEKTPGKHQYESPPPVLVVTIERHNIKVDSYVWMLNSTPKTLKTLSQITSLQRPETKTLSMCERWRERSYAPKMKNSISILKTLNWIKLITPSSVSVGERQKTLL